MSFHNYCAYGTAAKSTRIRKQKQEAGERYVADARQRFRRARKHLPPGRNRDQVPPIPPCPSAQPPDGHGSLYSTFSKRNQSALTQACSRTRTQEVWVPRSLRTYVKPRTQPTHTRALITPLNPLVRLKKEAETAQSAEVETPPQVAL